jgi:DNA-binding NtrC family response regulator
MTQLVESTPKSSPRISSIPRRRWSLELPGLGGIVGRSETMNVLFRQIEQAGPSAASVLIVGETGTGKELVARTLHRLSPRKSRPFIAVNCAAMPESLVESELFGHEKGAFTGASARSAGVFEQASGGTLFLDEISAMPQSQQAKLLRALQEGVIRRVGGDREFPVDVRVVAAMNVEPRDAMEEGTLRSDLYYRLSVFILSVPPLRQRRDDVCLLAKHFLHALAETECREAIGLDLGALRALRRHSWPGNVRELRNVLERAVILAGRTLITADHLPTGLVRGESAHPRQGEPPSSRSRSVALRTGMTLAQLKRQLIETTLEATGHDVAEAAKRLGVSSRTVYNKIKEWGLRSGSTASFEPRRVSD